MPCRGSDMKVHLHWQANATSGNSENDLGLCVHPGPWIVMRCRVHIAEMRKEREIDKSGVNGAFEQVDLSVNA